MDRDDYLYQNTAHASNGAFDASVLDEDAVADALEKDLEAAAVNYYAVLNVAETASEEEIKESYRRLCRTFHPDKHVDEEDKKTAEARFQAIQRAHEVLTSPERRAAYDLFGEAGLQSTWEVGPRLKTPDELRDEFERQARKRREQDLENLVKAKSTIQVDLDASQIIPPNVRRGRPKTFGQRMGSMEVKQFLMKHSFDTQLAPVTAATLTGHMISRNGVGNGNLLGTIRHTISPSLWAEATITAMSPRILHLKTFYNISSDSFLQVDWEFALGSWGRFRRDMLRREFSAIAIGITTQNPLFSRTIEMQTGLASSHLTVQYIHNFNKDLSARAATVLATNGLNLSVGVDRKVTENSKFGMAVNLGLGEGITLKLKFSRLGQRLVVPILLCREVALEVSFWAILIPTCGAVLVEQAVFRPMKLKKLKRRILDLRERHSEILESRKREALDSVRLMRESVLRRADQESAKNGLVILEATYGNVRQPESSLDVTIAVQALVNSSQLRISGGHSKSNIIGFYDPCLGESKRLRIRYKFQSKLHELDVDDKTSVVAPLRSHLIAES